MGKESRPASARKRNERPDLIDFRDLPARFGVSAVPRPFIVAGFAPPVNNQTNIRACTGFAQCRVIEHPLRKAGRDEARTAAAIRTATAKHLIHALAVVAFAACGSARAALLYDVTFDDPSGSYSRYYADIQSHVLAAGAAWDTYIVGDASLEVEIGFADSIPTVTGRSVTSSPVGNSGTPTIFEQGAAGEINTGVDPNKEAPDIEFTFNPTYLASELWFDPDPLSRTATIDSNKTDAVSVFLHEFGHAFAFNGWGDAMNGALPSGYASTFDEYVVFSGSELFFQGPRATSLFGGDVPLTSGNYGHLGNASSVGSALIPDLMNGVSFSQGTRYQISPLDLAILADAGLSIIPVPAAFWLFGSGLLGVVVMSGARRRSNRRKQGGGSVPAVEPGRQAGSIEAPIDAQAALACPSAHGRHRL